MMIAKLLHKDDNETFYYFISYSNIDTHVQEPYIVTFCQLIYSLLFTIKHHLPFENETFLIHLSLIPVALCFTVYHLFS